MTRKPGDPAELDPVRATRMLMRGVCRHCPNCGSGHLFTRWLCMRHACPGCHLVLDRGETDYFMGGFVLNFVAVELLIAAGGFVAVLLTWPRVPWTGIEIGLLAFAMALPALTYPFAKTLWLAVDLAFRPVRLGDLEGHGENAPEPEAARRLIDGPPHPPVLPTDDPGRR